jgi:predicted Holliday junction resolvase-like endonuclease
MKSALISSFHEFQNVLVVCPECNGIHRLSELKLSYRGRVKRTWFDEIRDLETKLDTATQRLKDKRDEIKAQAQERGRKQMPKLLKRCLPAVCAHGYYPQDLTALFDPVDFVVFDGMNLKEQVKRVVLFDGPAHDKLREKIQRSIRKVIEKGNYEWLTVKIDVTEEGKHKPLLVRISDEGKVVQ